MRYVSTCLPTFLIAAAAVLSLAGTASAQQSTWVDPPPRNAPAEAPKAEPVKPEAAKASPASVKTKSRVVRRRPVRVAKRPPVRTASVRPAARTRQHLAERQPVPQIVDSSGIAVIAENGAMDPRFPGWAGEAQQVARSYLDAIAPDKSSLASRIFGTYASLGPSSVPAPELRSDKRYVSLGNPLSTACNAERETCLVQTVVGCPSTGAEGASVQCELTLAVTFAGGGPRIVAEWLRPIAGQPVL